MKTLTMPLLSTATTAIVIGVSFLAFANSTGRAGDSSSIDEIRSADLSVTAQAAILPYADQALFVTAPRKNKSADRRRKQPASKQSASDVRKKNQSIEDEKLRIILSRQKGDQLKVYLNSRGAYINGKSISRDNLAKIIAESRLKQAILTAEPYLDHEKVDAWEALIRKSGVKQITLAEPKPAASNDEKLRIILARQKGDQLKVYLNSRGAYINGKSITRDDLAKLAAEAKFKQAILTAEPYLDREKVDAWEALIRKAGVKQITLAEPTGN